MISPKISCLFTSPQKGSPIDIIKIKKKAHLAIYNCTFNT